MLMIKVFLSAELDQILLSADQTYSQWSWIVNLVKKLMYIIGPSQQVHDVITA